MPWQPKMLGAAWPTGTWWLLLRCLGVAVAAWAAGGGAGAPRPAKRAKSGQNGRGGQGAALGRGCPASPRSLAQDGPLGPCGWSCVGWQWLWLPGWAPGPLAPNRSQNAANPGKWGGKRGGLLGSKGMTRGRDPWCGALPLCHRMKNFWNGLLLGGHEAPSQPKCRPCATKTAKFGLPGQLVGGQRGWRSAGI